MFKLTRIRSFHVFEISPEKHEIVYNAIVISQEKREE